MRLPTSLGALLAWTALATSSSAEDCPSPGLKRVVGYYEGEAMRRRCEQFNPEIIPGGVYTHLIFAHADIDPESFEVRPHAFDPPLYDRVSLVKRASPSTKIYISLGGKALNGPGVATFSKIARGTGPQIKFARSLLNFLESFGFDGVEIDWEHPVEEGVPGDFTNFPEWMRKLRLHLAAAGRGLSIAAPLGSYRDQYFDYKSLAENVDFINLKAYDLDSTVDFPKNWHGPELKAHTNLTQINAGLETILKNAVNPDKLVLGLAAYGRGYVPARNDCLEPGCEYASPIQWSHCNDQGGVRFYREISQLLDQTYGEPGTNTAHFKDEAIKVLSWGEQDKQWIAYDDEETLFAKAEYAQNKCLNGVALWAISQDARHLALSRALQRVTPVPTRPNMPTRQELQQKPSLRDEYKANRQVYLANIAKLDQDNAPLSFTQLDMTSAECLSGKLHAVQPGETCDSLAVEHSFATADLLRGNAGAISSCASALPVGVELCLPVGCAITHVLKEGDNCQSIERERREDIDRFGVVEKYNNWLVPDCANLHSASDEVYGHVLCLSPRGGKSTAEPLLLHEVRRGVDYVPPIKDIPIAQGTPERCAGWHVAQSGDTCTSLTLLHHVSIQELLEVNPSLEKFEGCSERITAGNAYCVLPLIGWKKQMERSRDEL